MAGTHRRLLASDVLAYRDRRASKLAALGVLTEADEDRHVAADAVHIGAAASKASEHSTTRYGCWLIDTSLNQARTSSSVGSRIDER
jgi:hypothetical protein